MYPAWSAAGSAAAAGSAVRRAARALRAIYWPASGVAAAAAKLVLCMPRAQAFQPWVQGLACMLIMIDLIAWTTQVSTLSSALVGRPSPRLPAAAGMAGAAAGALFLLRCAAH